MFPTCSADTIRKHSNLLSFFLSLTCLLFFVFLQTKVHADDTPFTVILQRKIPQGGEELQAVQAVHNGNLQDGYVIGPMAMQDGSRYTLELRSNVHSGGVIVYLRPVPKLNATIIRDEIRRQGVIGGVELYSRGDQYYYQMLNANRRSEGREIEIPIPQGQSANPIAYYRLRQADYALVDPIAVMQLIMSNSRKRGTGGEDELTDALSRLSLNDTPAECLLNFVDFNDVDSGFMLRKTAYMPVHSLYGPLQQATPPILLDKASAQGSSHVLAYSPHSVWANNVVTMPFFVEGEGDMQVPYGTKIIKGGLHYLDIFEQSDGIQVDLYPLNRPTVVIAPSNEKYGTKLVSIHISSNNTTIQRVGGFQKGVKPLQLENHPSVFKSPPVDRTFKNKLNHLDYVVLVNLITSLSYDCIGQQQSKNFYLTSDSETSNSFNCQQDVVRRRVHLDYLPDRAKLTIGFRDSHIHTYMMSHPLNPVSGLETGPIQLTDPDTQKQGLYSFVVSSCTHDSFEVSMHSLERQKSHEEHAMERAQALLFGRSNALVTLYAKFTGESTMAVELINRQGKKLLSETVTVDWNPEKNIFSVLPLPLNGSNSEWIKLPGIATCINLLSHATTGELDSGFNISLLPGIIHKQASTDVNHPQGAYYSESVYRDFTTVTHYHKNALWRNAVYGAKRIGAPALWGWNHPRTAVMGAAIVAGLVGSSVMYPNVTGQFLRDTVEFYGSSILDELFPPESSSFSAVSAIVPPSISPSTLRYPVPTNSRAPYKTSP